ncbi:complex I NDUFA9 subunit family protein [Natronorarus salvus]|uniref:complex I NDUFA9 subunit family protein n=1 Tax=Natronorarus salvus TaxID=3117733 RepID=UPI002F26C485
MNVLVTGGTGFIGSYLCDELAERGHSVTALSRSPDPSAVSQAVETVEGDVTDPDSLEGPIDGQDVVVNLVSPSPLWEPEGGNEMYDRIHRQGTENLVRLCEDAGVDRFVQQSGLITGDEDLTSYHRAKARAEEIVRESDLEYVIYRPSIVFGDGDEIVGFTTKLKQMFAPVGPLYPLPGGGERTYFQLIYVGDLAPMLADGVEGDEHANETYELGGPKVYSLREMTELVFESKGRDITIVPLPMALSKVGMTAMGVVPGLRLGPNQYRGLKADNRVSDNDVGVFGVSEDEMTTFEEYLGLA